MRECFLTLSARLSSVALATVLAICCFLVASIGYAQAPKAKPRPVKEAVQAKKLSQAQYAEMARANAAKKLAAKKVEGIPTQDPATGSAHSGKPAGVKGPETSLKASTVMEGAVDKDGKPLHSDPSSQKTSTEITE